MPVITLAKPNEANAVTKKTTFDMRKAICAGLTARVLQHFALRCGLDAQTSQRSQECPQCFCPKCFPETGGYQSPWGVFSFFASNLKPDASNSAGGAQWRPQLAPRNL